MSERRQPVMVGVFIVASLVLTAYGPSLSNPFVFDDNLFILDEPIHRSLANIPSFFAQDQHLLYRPLRSIAYALSYAAFGYDPVFYRLVALALHTAMALVIGGVALELGLTPAASLLVSVLSALHPVHADRAAFTTATYDLLGPVFGYTALIFMIRSHRRKSARDRRLASGLLLVALLGGEEGAMIPFLYIAWRALLGDSAVSAAGNRDEPSAGPAPSWRVELAVPLALTAAYLTVRTVILRQIERVIVEPPPLLARLANCAVDTTHALAKIVFPFALRPAYGDPFRSWADPAVWLCVAFWGAAGWAAWRYRRRDRTPHFLALWFLITWFPFANIIPNHTRLAERYLYLPTMAFCLAAGWLFDHAELSRRDGSRRRSAATVLVGVIVLLFGAMSLHRGLMWSNEKDLWGDAYLKDNRAGLVLINFANAFANKPDFNPCPLYRRALELNPERHEALVGLGECSVRAGRLDEALERFERARRQAPDAHGPLEGMCQVYVLRDQLEDAERCSRELLAIDPDSLVARYVLGYHAFRLGRRDEAVRILKEIADEKPGAAETARRAADLLKQIQGVPSP